MALLIHLPVSSHPFFDEAPTPNSMMELNIEQDMGFAPVKLLSAEEQFVFTNDMATLRFFWALDPSIYKVLPYPPYYLHLSRSQ